jgi:hypothetical protein
MAENRVYFWYVGSEYYWCVLDISQNDILFCISVSTSKKGVQSEVLVPIEEVIVEFIS